MQRPVAWMPFLLTKTAKQISIMTSVFRADNALSTVLLVRLLINPRFSRLSELYSPVKGLCCSCSCICWTVWSKSYSRKATCSHEGSWFADVFEVAIGADLCAKQEAEDFLKEVPDELPFMATSCCPAWSVMAKNSSLSMQNVSQWHLHL